MANYWHAYNEPYVGWETLFTDIENDLSGPLQIVMHPL